MQKIYAWQSGILFFPQFFPVTFISQNLEKIQYAFFICGRSEKGVVCITWLICLAHLFTYLVRVQNSFRNIFYSKGWRKINKKEDFSCGRSFFKTYFKFCLISMLVPSDLMYGQKAVFSHFDQKMAKFGQNLVKIWSFLKFQN